MQVILFKRKVTYTKDRETKNATNYLQINEEYVPIQIHYFKDKDTGEDKGYARRKGLVVAVASAMPERGDDEYVRHGT